MRFGNCEIYEVIESFWQISDEICVGEQMEGGTDRICLFLKMSGGAELTNEMKLKLNEKICLALQVKDVPMKIEVDPDIPVRQESFSNKQYS